LSISRKPKNLSKKKKTTHNTKCFEKLCKEFARFESWEVGINSFVAPLKPQARQFQSHFKVPMTMNIWRKSFESNSLLMVIWLIVKIWFITSFPFFLSKIVLKSKKKEVVVVASSQHTHHAHLHVPFFLITHHPKSSKVFQANWLFFHMNSELHSLHFTMISLGTNAN
jgi:hypothetical protein